VFSNGYFESSPNNDTLYSITSKMERLDSLIKISAGTFDALNLRSTIISNPKYSPRKNPRFNNTFYGKNVGKIIETWHYFVSLEQIGKKLIRYKIRNQ